MMNRFILNGLLIAGALLGQLNSAQAQIEVQKDVDGVICGLLPDELQGVCLHETYLSPNDPSPGQFCESVLLSSNRRNCHNFIRGHYFVGRALEFCTNILLNEPKLGCLRDIADVRYFQPEFMRFCSDLRFNNPKLDCLNIAKNSYIHQEDIFTCRKEISADDKLRCLNQYSQKVEYPNVIPPPGKRRGKFPWF